MARRFGFDGNSLLEGFLEYGQKDQEKILSHLDTAMFEKKEIKPQGIHWGRLMEQVIPQGKDIVNRISYGDFEQAQKLLESAGPAEVATFKMITSGIITRVVDDAFENPVLILDKLTTLGSTNRIYGDVRGLTSRIGSKDVGKGIAEGQEYGRAAPTEAYYGVPPTQKFGIICEITRELLAADLSGGRIVSDAREQATAESINFERTGLKTVLGIDNNFTFNGAAFNTYADHSANALGLKNLIPSNPLNNWTNWNTVVKQAAKQKHPLNRDLVGAMVTEALVPTDLYAHGQLVLSGPDLQIVDNQANATTYRISGKTPVSANTVLTSPHIADLNGSDTTWYAGGKFSEAFTIEDVWGQETDVRGADNPRAFTADIWMAIKVSRRSVIFLNGPGAFIKVYKCTA